MGHNNFYTGFGDTGKTRLSNGSIVSKADLRIVAAGNIEELSSVLSLIRFYVHKSPKKDELVSGLMESLYIAKSDILMPYAEGGSDRIEEKHTKRIEVLCDMIEELLDQTEPSQNLDFLPELPYMGLAMSVCRRAERAVVSANETYSVNPELLRFMNRFSSCLFLLLKGMLLL